MYLLLSVTLLGDAGMCCSLFKAQDLLLILIQPWQAQGMLWRGALGLRGKVKEDFLKEIKGSSLVGPKMSST
jgi:hypothetical protein